MFRTISPPTSGNVKKNYPESNAWGPLEFTKGPSKAKFDITGPLHHMSTKFQYKKIHSLVRFPQNSLLTKWKKLHFVVYVED